MRTFYIFILFLITTVTSARLYGQSEYSVNDIPKNLLSNASMVVRKEETTVEMRSINDVRVHKLQAYTILNENDKDLSTLVIGYYKSKKIDNVKGFIYDASGNLLRKFGLKDMKDESAVSSFSLYEDNRIKYFEPSSLSYPITVVYDYTVQLSQNLIIPDWIPRYKRDIAVQESKYSFICNTEDSIQYKEIHLTNPHTESLTGKGQKIYTWSVANIPAERNEPLAPPFIKERTSVKITPTQFYYYKYKGEYRNWTDLGNWFYTNLLSSQQNPTPHMQEVVNNIKAKNNTEQDVIKELYSYLQHNFRYISVQIGIGGFQPMSVGDVDRLGYGDCKALVNYMQTLLNIAQIPSYYCVVESGDSKVSMDPSFASMDQGNHVILMIPLAKDTMWLECTNSKIPAGFLGDFTDDRLVWACNKNSSFITQTPTYPAAQNKQTQTSTLTMDEDGNLTGNFISTFSGVQLDNHLHYMGLSDHELTKSLIKTYNVDNMHIYNINYKYDSSNSPQLNETFSIELPHYVAKQGDLFYLKANIFNKTSVPPTVRNRHLPLFLNRGYIDEDSVIIKLPENIHLENGNKNKTVQSIFGSYTIQVKEKNGALYFYRKILRKEGTFAPEQYEAYVDFMSSLEDLDSQKIILSKK